MKMLLLLSLSLLMPFVCSAKPLSDTTGAYAIEVPDDWKAARDARGMGLKNSNWVTSPDGKLAIAAGSTAVKAADSKLSLDDFARLFSQALARKGYQGSLSSDVIDGQDARVIQSVDAKGSRSALLVTRKDKTVAAVLLVSESGTEEYTAALNKLANGLHWLK